MHRPPGGAPECVHFLSCSDLFRLDRVQASCCCRFLQLREVQVSPNASGSQARKLAHSSHVRPGLPSTWPHPRFDFFADGRAKGMHWEAGFTALVRTSRCTQLEMHRLCSPEQLA